MMRIDFEVPTIIEADVCRSCGAPLAWAVTKAGKRMPLDMDTVETRDGKQYAETHFAHCKQAATWRKKEPRP